MTEATLESELLPLIRQGDSAAWRHLIDLYEGRLIAFAKSRLNNQAAAEDVVQEAFIGFLTSLPNYDETRSTLESFLFRITAYKITDVLRKQGRRPTSVFPADSADVTGQARKASSLFRSFERGQHQRQFLVEQLSELIAEWKAAGNFERLKTCELLFVRGWTNKAVAEALDLTQQQVANHKQVISTRLKLKSESD